MDTVKYRIKEKQSNPLYENNKGNTPLCFASGHDKSEIVEYLITTHQYDSKQKLIVTKYHCLGPLIIDT